MWAAVVLGTLVLGAAAVRGQATQAPGTAADQTTAQPAAPHACGMMSGRSTMADHHQTMASQKTMMAKLQAGEQALTELLGRMHAANGDDKLAAMAAVVTELAAQRAAMRQMMQMQGAMMERMMAHMSEMHAARGMKAGPAPGSDAPEPDHSAHDPAK